MNNVLFDSEVIYKDSVFAMVLQDV